MRRETKTLKLPDGTGGEPFDDGDSEIACVRTWLQIEVQVKKDAGQAFNADIDVQFSLDDGATWESAVSAVGGAEIAATNIDHNASHVKAVVANYATSTAAPIVLVVGRNAETGP